jgi:hypothetical protein
LIVAVAGIGISVAAAHAQEQQPPATLCKTETCSIQVEWGVSGPPLTTDRKYGPIAEYLPRIVASLETAGHRFAGEKQDKDVLTLKLRPKVVEAMCDEMSGTSTDMSCQMIGETEIEVHNPDPNTKLPGTIRVRNRCADNRMMDIAKFSEYSAGLIAYELSRDPKRKRPTARC